MNSNKQTIQKIREKYKTIPESAKAAFWFMVCNVMQRGISVITTPIFTRLLTTDQYGQYTLYNSWLAIFTLICTLRLTYSVFNKGMSKYPDNKDEYAVTIQSTITIITTICLIVYLLFYQLINSFTELSTFITLCIFVEVYFSQAIIIWTLRQRYDFKYRNVVVSTILLSISNPILGLIAVSISNEKGLARIISCVLVQCLFGIVFYIINIVKGRALFNKTFAKFSILFNLPLIPHYLSTYVLNQADRIMIQKMCGLSQAALYGVAYSAGSLMKIITDSINNALVPWIYRKLEKEDYKSIEKYGFIVSAFVMITCTIFICFAPELIYLLAGNKYVEAVNIIPPVASSMFFIFLFSMFANIEFYFDANKFTMFISMLGAILNIVLNYVGIQLLGYQAAGYTTLICYSLFCVLHFLYLNFVTKKKINKYIFEPKIMFALFAMMIVVTIVMKVLYAYSIIRYSIIISLLSIVFANYKRLLMLTNEIRRRNR